MTAKIYDLPFSALTLAMRLGATFDTTVYVLGPALWGTFYAPIPAAPRFATIEQPLDSLQSDRYWDEAEMAAREEKIELRTYTSGGKRLKAGYGPKTDVFVVVARGDDWRDWEGDSSE